MRNALVPSVPIWSTGGPEPWMEGVVEVRSRGVAIQLRQLGDHVVIEHVCRAGLLRGDQRGRRSDRHRCLDRARLQREVLREMIARAEPEAGVLLDAETRCSDREFLQHINSRAVGHGSVGDIVASLTALISAPGIAAPVVSVTYPLELSVRRLRVHCRAVSAKVPRLQSQR